MKASIFSKILLVSPVAAFVIQQSTDSSRSVSLQAIAHGEDRRGFLASVTTSAAAVVLASLGSPEPAQAVGPIKLALEPIKYKAAPCPPSKPIPGEKAMFGMRGLCVTVEANLLEGTPKDLEKVGVYGFVVDEDTGNSVLANNPDLR